MAVGELEAGFAALDGVQHGRHLLRHHREHLEVDAVELVEAAPAAALREALVDGAHDAVVHLVAAVEDHRVLAERVAHVLGRLGLAGARGAGGRATEAHAERLAQRNVAAVGERRDHEALLDAEVLVAVVKVDVGDGDQRDVLVVLEVEARLLLPLKVVGILDLGLDHVGKHVALVHVDQDHRLDLGARPLAMLQEVLVGQQVERDQVVQPLLVLLVGGVHDPLDRLRLVERVLAVEGPLELDADQRHLRLVLVRKVGQRHLLAVGRGGAHLRVHGALHRLEQLVQPLLDVAHRVHGLLELYALALRREERDDPARIGRVELDAHHRVEDRLQVRLHRLRVAALREHFQQVGVPARGGKGG